MNELMKFRQDLSKQQIASISEVFTLLDSHIEHSKTNTLYVGESSVEQYGDPDAFKRGD